MRKVMIAVAVWVTGISCTPKPEEIKYGEDLCHFCSMAIVDDKFSAQYVTKKGRAYKFDAIECMIHELEEKQEGEIALLLVSDFNNPGLFIDARAASFIVSKSISSPMGANLLALKDTKAIPDIVSGNDTQQYNWADICIKLQD